MRKLFLPAALVAATVAALVLAATSSAAVPQSTAPPSIGGAAQETATLTASDGGWSNSPTSFAYQWQRCHDDGTSCADISGATGKTYTVAAADVGHTLRVVVTATNSDGKTAAKSAATDVVDSANGPRNNVKPSLSGGSTVGDTLTVSNGLWTPTPTSYGHQWQRCNSTGGSCTDLSGETGKSYNVSSADIGHRLRTLVTAHTAAGQTTVATAASAVVVSSTVTTTNTTTTTLTTTTTVTTTTPAPTAPTVRVLSVARVGTHVRARFRVCAQKPGFVHITERDQKARALPYTRHFTVYVGGCSTVTKTWVLLARYRHPGRFLVALRAKDGRGLLSPLASRSIVLR